jgi:hypothetical protein
MCGSPYETGVEGIIFPFSMEITWCGVNVDVRPVSRFIYICVCVSNVTTWGLLSSVALHAVIFVDMIGV